MSFPGDDITKAYNFLIHAAEALDYEMQSCSVFQVDETPEDEGHVHVGMIMKLPYKLAIQDIVKLYWRPAAFIRSVDAVLPEMQSRPEGMAMRFGLEKPDCVPACCAVVILNHTPRNPGLN